MTLRGLIRPWPLFLMVLFGAVAVADFVHTLLEEKPPPPDLVVAGAVQFTMREPVFDLWAGSREPEAVILPIPFRIGPWSESGKSGTWVLGDGAALEFSVDRGGHRTLVLDCRPTSDARGLHSIELFVNGESCGTVDLEGEAPYHYSLPEGAVRPGKNTLEFHRPGPAQNRKSRRLLLVRQVALLLDEESMVEIDTGEAALKVEPEGDHIVINSAGRLRIPFVLDDRTDALQLRYKFSTDSGVAKLQVTRPDGSGEGLDSVVRRTLSAEQRRTGRVRVPLHGRRGEFVLLLDVDPGSASGRLKLTSVRLVKEGDPTLRRR